MKHRPYLLSNLPHFLFLNEFQKAVPVDTHTPNWLYQLKPVGFFQPSQMAHLSLQYTYVLFHFLDQRKNFLSYRNSALFPGIRQFPISANFLLKLFRCKKGCFSDIYKHQLKIFWPMYLTRQNLKIHVVKRFQP